jgi:hypothetical protein
MATKEKAPPDPQAVAKVDQALTKIKRQTSEIEAIEADLAGRREERNLLVFQSTALRPKANGRPTLAELSRAMNTAHSYTRRVIIGKGHPIAAYGRNS